MGGNKGSWEDGQRLRVFWDGAILRLFWNSKQQLNFLFCVFWEKPSNLFISYFCKTLNVLKVFLHLNLIVLQTAKYSAHTNSKQHCADLFSWNAISSPYFVPSNLLAIGSDYFILKKLMNCNKNLFVANKQKP